MVVAAFDVGDQTELALMGADPHARDAVPTIRSLRERAERTRAQELDAAMKQLARGDDPASVLEALSQGLTNKLLHGPSQALNSASGNQRASIAALIARIYQLHQDQ